MKRILLKSTVIALLFSALLIVLDQRSHADSISEPQATQQLTTEKVQKNIKVLTGLPQSQLIPVMNFMAASMGRRCNFCHVNNQGQWDYASDAKPEKNTAREMIKMVVELHKQKFDGADEISCFTCHRGQNRPVNLPALPLPLPSPRPPAAPAGPGAPAAATVAPGAQASPSPTPALPSADEIFGKYIVAIGGQANIDKIKSRTLKGSTTQVNGGTISFESEQAAPDKVHILAILGQGTVERGFDGTVSWEKSARGVRPLTDVEVAQLQSSVGLFRNIKLKEQFTSTRVRPGVKIGDRATYMVIGTAADNRQERLFFDAETGLLLRRVSYITTMVGLIPDQIDFEDYRDVDGVKLPFTVRVSSIDVGNPVATRTFLEIKLNAPVDESKFKMPPSTPAKP